MKSKGRALRWLGLNLYVGLSTQPAPDGSLDRAEDDKHAAPGGEGNGGYDEEEMLFRDPFP